MEEEKQTGIYLVATTGPAVYQQNGKVKRARVSFFRPVVKVGASQDVTKRLKVWKRILRQKSGEDLTVVRFKTLPEKKVWRAEQHVIEAMTEKFRKSEYGNEWFFADVREAQKHIEKVLEKYR